VDGVVEKSLMRRHAKQVVQGIVLGWVGKTQTIIVV
jgi:hypothetical protein